MISRPAPFRLTVPRYKKMIEVGILDENDKVELIRGELVAKMPIGNPHAACVNRLNRNLIRGVGAGRGRHPEPRPARGQYAGAGRFRPGLAGRRLRRDAPTPADVFLIIEVADSSLDYDRNIKGPLYAENGIAEYWIANLVDRCLEVHRRPRPDGTYADVRTFRPGDTADVAALPGVTVE